MFALPIVIVFERRRLLSAEPVSIGSWDSSSAAAAAACGAAPEVPGNVVYGAVPVETLSGAQRSGFVNPELVGP